ncbi:hypothetical protein AX15_000848 [Amanita polypyramis BW_CC]|nr:hypothetical protein AX15_000848 [Amanita polypyramis BW_CC]
MKRDVLHSDITRILDPSYAPTAAKLPPAVYVDTHGNIHDPDYRQFPTIAPPPSQSLPDDDDDVTPVDNDFYSHLTNAYNRSGNAHVHPRQRYNRYSHIYASYRSPYHYFSTPATTSSGSPPGSYESDTTVLDEADDSTFVDDSHCHINTFKKKLSKRRGSGSSNSNSLTSSPSRRHKSTEDRRPSWPVSETLPRVSDDESRHGHLPPHEELDERDQFSSHLPPSDTDDFGRSYQQPSHLDSEKQEWTPTCTQNLRRQWQALSLRFRFSLFRAQRRVKRRIQGLI